MQLQDIVIYALLLVPSVDAASPPFDSKAKPYSQEFRDNYNFLKYMNSLGPYTDRRGVGIDRDPPRGCRVDQVSMIHRHGARYPDSYFINNYAKSYDKLVAQQGNLKGDLEFANYWKPFIEQDDGLVSQESFIGPYAGLKLAYDLGVNYRARYGHLWDEESVVPLFSAGFRRIVMTARKFGEGFLGFNYTDLAALNIISEDAENGANSLTPSCRGKTNQTTTCPNPDTQADHKNWFLNPMLWNYEEFERAARRLNRQNPELNLTASDIPNLMSLAPFELNVRGYTPWENVFTSEEWYAFNYLNSATYYCYLGPGSLTAPKKGSVYVNATRTLLNQGPSDSLPMIWSFAHDSDISAIVSFLGIDADENLDVTKVTFGQKWDLSEICPQNGHLVIERLICNEEDVGLQNDLVRQYPGAFNVSEAHPVYAQNGSYPGAPSNLTTGEENIYVRVVLNEAVVPLTECNSGPGKSCKLSEFNSLMDSLLDKHAYLRDCNVSSSWPSELTFFWDYNTTNTFNLDKYPIGYQESYLDWNDLPGRSNFPL